MRELLCLLIGIAIGAVFHKDIPYFKDVNTRKLKRHLTGVVDVIKEAK
tara:strand:- start:11953 stop:12096 length:144 start_codon:yes stop_codon:yes gene_type:complete